MRLWHPIEPPQTVDSAATSLSNIVVPYLRCHLTNVQFHPVPVKEGHALSKYDISKMMESIITYQVILQSQFPHPCIGTNNQMKNHMVLLMQHTFCTRASNRVRLLFKLLTCSRFLVLTFLANSSNTG